MAMLMSILCLLFASYPFLNYYLEKRKQFFILLILNKMKGRPSAQLNKNHQDKLYFYTYIMIEFMIKKQGLSTIIVFSTACIYLYYLALTDPIVKPNQVLLTLSIIDVIILVTRFTIVGLSESVLFFLTILYFRYRFIQFVSNLKSYIIRNNKQLIMRSIARYKSLCEMLDQLSPQINYIIE